MFNIRREQGRLAEVEGAVRGFIELYPAIPAWRGALALLLVELGRPDEARAEFERSPSGGFAAFPRDANWLIAITLLAEVCGALGDAARAAELYGLLEPYAGRNVVVGRNATYNGSASRLLGILAAAARRARRWPSATSTRPRQMHARWAPGPGTPAPRCPTPRCCWRGGAGTWSGRGDARRRDLVADALGMVVLAERARRLVPAGASADPRGPAPRLLRRRLRRSSPPGRLRSVTVTAAGRAGGWDRLA